MDVGRYLLPSLRATRASHRVGVRVGNASFGLGRHVGDGDEDDGGFEGVGSSLSEFWEVRMLRFWKLSDGFLRCYVF